MCGSPLRCRSSEAGFTVIEVLVASVMLVTGILGVFLLLSTANSTAFTTRSREGAVNLARQVLEAAHAIPYADLNQQEVVSKLQQQPYLQDGSLSSGGYQVTRRGVVYTITPTVCSIDDPADGTGPHDSGTYCADSAGSSGGSGVSLDFSGVGTQVDGSVQLGGGTPDDYKRVIANVSWTVNGLTRTITQGTLIDDPGNSAGVSISAMAAVGLSSPVITSPSTSSVTFTMVTTAAPFTTNWTVNGVVQSSTPTGAGTAWTFTWPLTNVPDGTYIIGAQAYASNGLAGTPRQLTFTLNRSAPSAPQVSGAGRDGSAVDLEWLPNPEGDIVGYRVYRQGTGGPTLVCALTTATACRDTSPPSSLTLNYYVVAVDRDPAGNLREGAATNFPAVPLTSTPPSAPRSLTATTSTSGSTVLSWQGPLIPDLTIAFYRIYRDGNAYVNRYDRTGDGSTLTYTDTQTGGTTHTYYITAVNSSLAESTMIGPVTR